MRSNLCTLLAALMSVSAVSAPAAGASFQGLGGGEAYGVSGDGSVVVGRTYDPSEVAFRWTRDGGMVRLGVLPDPGGGYYYSKAYGVSGDGSVVVGDSSLQAFRWTGAGGMVGLGDLPGGLVTSRAYAVSGDGSVIVGESFSASGLEAFRWTSAGGMVGLGDLPGGGFYSTATGVSGDGSVIVGYSYETAFRWTSAGGMESLWDVLLANGVDPAADGWTRLVHARGVSADGNTIVGYGTRNGNNEAFRWTSAGSLFGLGDLAGGIFSSTAVGVSADGSVIFGGSSTAPSAGEMFRWTSDTGMEPLWDVLLANGVDPAADGWTRTGNSPRAISADGTTFVGYGGQAFVAVIPQPSSISGDYNQNGVVDAADYVVWRKGLGTHIAYDTWRSNFGTSLGAGSSSALPSADLLSAALPEPASVWLLIIGAAVGKWKTRGVISAVPFTHQRLKCHCRAYATSRCSSKGKRRSDHNSVSDLSWCALWRSS